MPRPTLHRIPALAALLACALLALLPAAPAAAAPARVIAVAGDNNFPPFEFVAADGEFRGFDVEISRSPSRPAWTCACCPCPGSRRCKP